MNRITFQRIYASLLVAFMCTENCTARLTVQVDKSTGNVQILNPEDSVIEIDQYAIVSHSGSLHPDGWISLQDQGLATWQEQPTADKFALGESLTFLGEFFALPPGSALHLGMAYDVSLGSEDLFFNYHDSAHPNLISPGDVTYFGGGPVGVIGDYNADGIVSHADYSVLGDSFGSDTPLPNRGSNSMGPVGFEDFHVYANNYGNSNTGASPSILPFTIASSATANGNTQWILTFQGVAGALAGHLNIQTDGASILSVEGGALLMDDGVNPLSVPGFDWLGNISTGATINGNRAFAALGTTLGRPFFGAPINFLTLVTNGVQPTTLTVAGEYGYQGIDYFIETSAMFSSTVPGSSPSNPVLPVDDGSGDFFFPNVPSGVWFDPPLVPGFEYIMESESLFTAILEFPPGFDGPFRVSAEGMLLGIFDSSQSVDFVALLGHGVEQFIVSGIAPAVDAEDPNAFPLRIAFNTPIASFRMVAIPEPSGMVLGAIAAICVAIAVGGRIRANIFRMLGDGAAGDGCYSSGLIVLLSPHPHFISSDARKSRTLISF